MTTETRPVDSPLDQIFKKVDQARERPGYAIVRIDARTREIVSGKSVVRRILGGSIETYELKLDTPVEIYDSVETIRIFGTQENASIGFRISVTARSAEAQDIVRVLASVTESPYERLMGVIRAAMKRAADRINAQSPDGLTANIFSARETWQEEMQRTIADKTGLEVRFIFNPPPNGNVTSRAFTVRNHEMATRDAPHRVYSLVFTVTLEPNGQPIHDPLAPSDQVRVDRARQIIGRQLPAEICLYDLWFDRERVEGALRAVLSNGLRSTGYTVADLVLEPIEAPLVREEQISCPVVWTGRAGRKIQFSVEAVLRLRREATGRFDALHIPSRRAWLQEEAERALKIAMHARDFEDLNLQEQRAVEEHVVRLLRDSARATGQDIEPLVANVLLPEGGWLQRELLELPPTRYPTRNPLIDAEFAITVELSLRTLRTVIDRLRMRTAASNAKHPIVAPDDFTPLIRDEVTRIVAEAARVTMSSIEADDYFGNFEPWSFPGDAAPPVLTESHVKMRLVKAIEQALRQRLDIDFLEIGLRRTDSKVGDLYQEILALNPVVVEVKDILTAASLGSADDMGVTLRVRSRIPNAERSPAMIRCRGSEPFDKAKVVEDIVAAAKQFLRHRQAIEIMELGKGAIPRVDGKPPLFVELREYLCRHIEDIYGFPVHLDHADPILSQKIIAERARIDVAVKKENLHTVIISDDIDDMSENVTLHRRRLDRQIKALDEQLLETSVMNTETRARLKKEIAELEAQRSELVRTSVQRLTVINVPPPLSYSRSDAEPGGGAAARAAAQSAGEREPAPPRSTNTDSEDGGF